MSSQFDQEDDDIPTLSVETLKALQEFYAENQVEEKKEIDENWQLSQFWYNKETSETLALEVLTNAVTSLKEKPGSEFNIGCISCPTLFKTLYEYVVVQKCHDSIKELASLVSRVNIHLFEYDKRFGDVYGDYFSFYDYKNPLSVDAKFEHYFDLIIADPPYLADECHIKTGMTIRKTGKAENGQLKLLVCTGAIMEDLLAASLKVRLVKFVPRHERNLANEFKCYVNYDCLFLDK